MSFSNFMIHGLSGNQTAHLRSQFPADVVVAGQGRAGFDGEEFWDEDATTKRACIDSVVQVNTVCTEVREDERSFWKGHKNTSMIVFTVTLIGGVASAIAAIVASSIFPPILAVVVLTSIVSFNLFGFSFFTLYRHMQAKDQYKEWKDPLPHLIEQRKQVGVQGFGYAYQEQLRGKLVTDTEVEDLWYADMEKIKMNFLGAVSGLYSVQAQKVRDFFETGHLGHQKLSYALQENISPQLQYLSDQYQGLKAQYSEVRKVTDRFKRSISMQQNERLRANDRQRDLQMAPWIQWFNANYRIPLQQEREVVVLQTRGRGAVVMTGHQRGCRTAVGEYDARLAHMQVVFESMTAPIRALHERNAQAINQWAAGELRTIQQGEEQQLTLFFNPICRLLSQYTREEVIQPHQQYPYEPQQERLYPDLAQDFSPSAPDLEESYRPPAYNPEWKSVVGEVDWENGVLEVTTTRRVYR